MKTNIGYPLSWIYHHNLLAVLIKVVFTYKVVDTVEDAINYILKKECIQWWYHVCSLDHCHLRCLTRQDDKTRCIALFLSSKFIILGWSWRLTFRLSPAVYSSTYSYSNSTLRIIHSTIQNNVFDELWVDCCKQLYSFYQQIHESARHILLHILGPKEGILLLCVQRPKAPRSGTKTEMSVACNRCSCFHVEYLLLGLLFTCSKLCIV